MPKAWKTGSVRGLKARGGFVVDIEWADGKLRSAKLVSAVGETAVVRYGDKTVQIETDAGETLELNGSLEHR